MAGSTGTVVATPPVSTPNPARQTTRCEALFASDLQSSRQPDAVEIGTAIDTTIHTLGARGCLERVAQEFGDHPELAVTRMRWATSAVCGPHPGGPSSAGH